MDKDGSGKPWSWWDLTKDKGKGIKDKQDTLKAKGGGRDKG
jgi:hypothetical protein